MTMNNPARRPAAFLHNQHGMNTLQRHEPGTNPRSATRHEPYKKEEFVATLSLALRSWAMGQSASRCRRTCVDHGLQNYTLAYVAGQESWQNRAAHSGVATARSSGTIRAQRPVNDWCYKRLDVNNGCENRSATRANKRRCYSESTSNACRDTGTGV